MRNEAKMGVQRPKAAVRLDDVAAKVQRSFNLACCDGLRGFPSELAEEMF